MCLFGKSMEGQVEGQSRYLLLTPIVHSFTRHLSNKCLDASDSPPQNQTSIQ